MFNWIFNKIRKELTPLVAAELRTKLEPEIRAEIEESTRLADTVRASLLRSVDHVPAELAERMSAKVDELVAARMEPLRQELLTKLAPEVRSALEAQLLPEVERKLEISHQKRLQAARDRTLLEYLVQESGGDIGTFFEGLPLKVRLEVRSNLRNQLTPQVLEELKAEIRPAVMEQETPSVRKQVRSELLNSPDVRTDVRQTLKRELRGEVEAALREEIKPAVESKLMSELMLPILLDRSGNTEGTVGGVLRRHFAESMEEIRQAVYDETWKTVATAIVEAFGAANRMDDVARVAAMEAAIRSYGAKSEETQRKVHDAVEAALNVLGADVGLFGSSWERYCSLARDLIDDRIFPSAPGHQRNLQVPDGFYRAVVSHVCSRTGHPIRSGDYYLVLKGQPIAVPIRRSDAENLLEETQRGSLEAPPSTIPPPWPGIPISAPTPPVSESSPDSLS